MSVVMNDEDAQRRGVVWLCDGIGKKTKVSSQSVRDVVPVFFGAIHLLFTEAEEPAGSTSSAKFTSSHSSSSLSTIPQLTLASSPFEVQNDNGSRYCNGNGEARDARTIGTPLNWKLLVKNEIVTQDVRVRIRKHYGERSQIIKALATFGIPHQVTINGVGAKNDFMEWLRLQWDKEVAAYAKKNNGNYVISWPAIESINGQAGLKSMNQSHEARCAASASLIPSPAKVHSATTNETMPMHDTTHTCVAHLQQNCHLSRQTSADSIPNGMILTPRADDVLFGRSKISVDHPGNVRFKQLVEMNLDVYYNPSSSRITKAQIARMIVKTMTEAGGRFLRKVPSQASDTVTGSEVEYWFEVDSREAQSKVAHQFRNRRQKKS
jgi:hypothetical protein